MSSGPIGWSVPQPGPVINQPMPMPPQPYEPPQQPNYPNNPIPPMPDNRLQQNSACPPGLEPLLHVSAIVVKQKVELLEAFTGWETENKYEVLDGHGNKLFHISERSDCCARMCCRNLRPCEFKMYDSYGREVMHINRPLNCMCCWLCCCLQEIQVTSNGYEIGSVHQNMSFCKPSLTVRNQSLQDVFTITGPLIQCWDVPFKVKSLNGNKIGKIRKKWSGFGREVFTDSDTFGIDFPLDLDINMKALLLAATILVDFMYFEDNNRR